MKFKGSQYADTRASSWMKEKSITASCQVLSLQPRPLPPPRQGSHTPEACVCNPLGLHLSLCYVCLPKKHV